MAKPQRLTASGVACSVRSVAAKSATGFDSPQLEAHQRPSHDARRFFVARLKRSGQHVMAVLWRAVYGDRKVCRSSSRSVNRAPSATSFDSEAVVSQLLEDTHMAAAALSNTASHSPVMVSAQRRALDMLEDVTTALQSLRDLLIPGDDLAAVARDDLAMLFGLLADQQRAGGERAELATSARVAVVDLIGPGHDLHCVSRDHLCALVDLLAQVHATAMQEVRDTLGSRVA